MEYQSLVNAGMFEGLRADVLLTCTAVLGIIVVVAGVGYIARVLTR